MDKQTRNAIERATQKARRLLEDDYASQLEGTYDILPDGHIGDEGGAHRSARQAFQRDVIVAALERKRATGMSDAAAVADYLRDAAFTTLNRFVALKLLEARKLLQECVSNGEQSAGYLEYCGMAPGLTLLPDGAGYRLYVESLFDELSTEIKVLFDRRDPASVLWPRRQAFDAVFTLLNAPELNGVWAEDETLGWVYQYFNGADERKRMRDESQAPRNSRELAVRNQFFTPRYVVQFLVDNSLGRTWLEMHGDQSGLLDMCEYFVRPVDDDVPVRRRKDPRDLRILDPACGSGHFLLYSFDLLLAIYEEAWEAADAMPASTITGRTLRADYPDLAALREAAPALIIENNLYGVEIDARCGQIAALALWLRAQRAYQDLGLSAGSRPQIRRTHIVIAEPMPGNRDLAASFATGLNVPFLQVLFDRMVEEMRLAGDLGVLLQLERSLAEDITSARRQFQRAQERPELFPDLRPRVEQGRLDLTGITDDSVFHEAEGTILDALRRFAASAGGSSARRRLFADDAAQGVALIDLVRTRFDVVLMNPPFGQSTPRAYDYIRTEFKGSHADIYAAFVTRARQLAPQGYVGAITSRSFLMAPRLEGFRETEILPSLAVLLDLGLGVMDDAFVESAAFVLGSPAPKRFLVADSRSGRNLDPSRLPGSAALEWRSAPRDAFATYPQKKILYALPQDLFSSPADIDLFEPAHGTAREGMKSFDNERFLRLAWEVSPSSIGVAKRWTWFVKGGSHALYYSPVHLLLNWNDAGSEPRAVNEIINGSTAQVRQASDYWYRPGVTYSKRSSKGFSARCLPAGCVFSSNGPAVLPSSSTSPLTLLGWLNSRPVRALIHLQSNAGDYSTGAIKRLPWPRALNPGADLVDATLRAVTRLAARAAYVETDPGFVFPRAAYELHVDGTPEADATAGVAGALDEVAGRWDAVVMEAYGLQDEVWIDDVLSASQETGEPIGPSDDDVDDDDSPATPSDDIADLSSWAAGVALGRYDVRFAARTRTPPPARNAFDALPATSPGMLTGDDGLPLDRPPSGYPIAFPVDGILVDDPGHPRDLVAAVRSVFDVVFGSSAEGIWQETAELLDPKGHDLRSWLRASFFEHHLKRHSKSRRKAPILWQLGVPSARYSIWTYAHRLTRDSLFALGRDVVAPKVDLEERRRTSLVQEAGSNPTAKQRAEIAAQDAIVEELRAFATEVRRVAPLWNPDLDDGIVLVSAPLWRLVPAHKAWQKELKSRWDDLVAGKYDWAHLSMHLWPERVVPKCATDRSLAIAHGLEDVFWVEGSDGKWTKRAHPTRSIDDLVAERTSPAVKAALTDLLTAPAPAGAGGRGRRAA